MWIRTNECFFGFCRRKFVGKYVITLTTFVSIISLLMTYMYMADGTRKQLLIATVARNHQLNSYGARLNDGRLLKRDVILKRGERLKYMYDKILRNKRKLKEDKIQNDGRMLNVSILKYKGLSQSDPQLTDGKKLVNNSKMWKTLQNVNMLDPSNDVKMLNWPTPTVTGNGIPNTSHGDGMLNTSKYHKMLNTSKRYEKMMIIDDKILKPLKDHKIPHISKVGGVLNTSRDDKMIVPLKDQKVLNHVKDGEPLQDDRTSTDEPVYHNSVGLHPNMCSTKTIPPHLINGSYRNMLTLFTTFRTTPEKFNIYNNTLHNWAMLIPDVQPVLFTDTPRGELETVARELGWEILPVLRKNYEGTPILKDMFMYFQKPDVRGRSAFYGFSNGDILFNSELIRNLKQADTFFRKHKKCLMIVGQRKNYDIAPDERLYLPEDVDKAASKVSKWFGSGAEDFFFFPRNLFPWRQIPEVVIGRPGYDNFLVIHSRKIGVGVIDATKTLLALHQTGKDGNKAGEQSVDADYNIKLIKLHFPSIVLRRYGDSDLTKYYTKKHHRTGSWIIKKRK